MIGVFRLSGIVILAIVLLGQGARADADLHTWRPCVYEDDVHCVWDARHLGNGEGRFFKVQRDGERVYITHRRAHRLIDWRS